MSSTRDALMLVAGAAIGAVSTFAIVNGAGPAADRAPAAPVAGPATAGPKLEVAQRALDEERATRVRAEERSAALEAELAAARSAAPASAPEPRASGVASSASSAPSAKKALDAAQIAARLRDIEAALPATVEAKDGKKLLALYVELAGYGKEGWPLAKKIGAIFGHASGEGLEDELGLKGMEFFKTFAAAEFSELYADALAHPDGYDKDFRQLAVWGLSMGDPAAAGPALVQTLRVEKDSRIIMGIAGMLAQGEAQPGAADAIVDALRAQKNAQTRQSLIWSLTHMKGDEATRAIGALAAAETDPGVKQQLEVNLKVRSAPVAGYFVSFVTPQSVAEQAGLKVGDVLTTLNGKALKGWQQLQTTGEGDEAPDLAFSVYRDGQTFVVNMKGGKPFWELGFSGDFARGTAR